ncbi:MAG: DUF5711 family protein [Oscillospiraceae bacterium]|nr:DUF5711 family protein [Oscillospiraceae bacterium]
MLFFLLILLTFAGTVLFAGGELTLAGVARAYAVVTGSVARDLSFSSGYDSVFAPMKSGVISAGSNGVAVYGLTGDEVARETFSMNRPALAANGMSAVIYDCGGRQLRVVDSTGVRARLEADGDIVSASIGKNGYIVVCTMSEGAYLGIVRVYQLRAGTLASVYEWYSGGDFVLSAAVSGDNKRLAVLTLGSAGGRVVLMRLASTRTDAEALLPGSAILEAGYLRDGTLLARSRDAVYAVSEDGALRRVYTIPEGMETLGWTTEGGNFAAIYVQSGGAEVGPRTLALIDGQDEPTVLELSGLETFVSLHASGDRVALLRSDGLWIYNQRLRALASYDGVAAYSEAYPTGGASALAAGARVGHIYKP